GVLAGEALEDAMSNGFAVDELFVYEHALQQGRTAVIVFANDDGQANHAREIMQSAGAESIETARHPWRVGLRATHAEDYLGEGSEFETSEETYRRGFETDLHPAVRGRANQEAEAYLKRRSPSDYNNEVFKRGFERGRKYYESFMTRNGKP